MRFRTLLVALATAFSLALASAAPALAVPGDGVASGKVTDSATGQALANVCVVNGPVASVCWSITNAAGEYQLIIPGLPATGFATNLQFFRPGYTPVSRNINLMPDQSIVENTQMISLTPGVPTASVAPPPFLGNPPPATTTVNVEQRIADFWKRVDALQPGDNLLAADLGQWALNVIERNPRARTSAADFRSSTAEMQAGLDRAGLAPAPAVAPTATPNIEQRIADFWAKIDALQPSAHVSAGDLGQWALNVIGRNPLAQLNVADFRSSTAGMQAGLDSAGLAP